jgi:voltage-gated potassium channel Kch
VTDSLQQHESKERLERRAFLRLQPDQDATFDELMAAADWKRGDSGPFVDSDGAAQILGVTPRYVARLAAQGRLPWLPTGRSGGQPTRVYRRAQIEVIARATNLRQAQCGTVSRELAKRGVNP